ncbi:hypothetical protein [Streptomyces sp. NPDC054797]
MTASEEHSEPTDAPPPPPPAEITYSGQFTHEVLTRFATGRLYANVIAPELPGGETG